MSATADRSLRIGEVAELTGHDSAHDPLLRGDRAAGPRAERAQGKHRVYTQADVDRVREIIRLRDLLGLSLEQLSQLLEAESARAQLRDELAHTEDPQQRKRILEELLTHISNQLDLVDAAAGELTDLAAELGDKQRRVKQKIREIDAQ